MLRNKLDITGSRAQRPVLLKMALNAMYPGQTRQTNRVDDTAAELGQSTDSDEASDCLSCLHCEWTLARDGLNLKPRSTAAAWRTDRDRRQAGITTSVSRVVVDHRIMSRWCWC